MQRKRYGEKRKGGYVDMGKQVRLVALLYNLYFNIRSGSPSGARQKNYQRPRRHEQQEVQKRQARPPWGLEVCSSRRYEAVGEYPLPLGASS
jgi:hypothetical protein